MRISRFIVTRTAQGSVVLLGVSVVVFFCLFLTGDPASLMMPPDASRSEIAAFREAMGFDDPVWVQYGRFLAGLFQGDLGTSLRFQRPALELVVERLPATALLAVAALAWSTLAGFVFGVVGAVKRDGWLDLFVRLIALSGQAIPVFWLGLLLILFFSLRLRWLPTGGIGGVEHLILPAVSLGAYYIERGDEAGPGEPDRGAGAGLCADRARQGPVGMAGDHPPRLCATRSSPWSPCRACTSRRSWVEPSSPRSSSPGPASAGWPSRQYRTGDFPLVQAVVLLAAFVFVVANLVVDIVYAVLNPRIAL